MTGEKTMFGRNSQNAFDFRVTAQRCAMGDVDAMYQMSKWFRSQLDREFLAWEQDVESYPKDVSSEKESAATEDRSLRKGIYFCAWGSVM